VRKVALVATGYNRIEYLINDILLSLNKIDKAVISAYNLENGTNKEFEVIEESFNEFNSYIEKTNKGTKNIVSKFSRKINQTYYYYYKINQMMNLFIKAVDCIKTSKNQELDATLKELYNLANSIDKNENRVFSKLMLETHIFAFYNRVVGYRNTARGIVMLHTVIDFILKKMIVIKDKSATLDVPKNKKGNGFFRAVDSNPAHASKI